MTLAKSTTFLAAVSLISKVSTHGIVQGIVAGGEWYVGYNPNMQYLPQHPKVAGWYAPEDIDTGYVNNYQHQDIICHKGATPGEAYVPVVAGGSLGLQWTNWPADHHDAILDYLAVCGDDCTTVDKTTLLWNKIDEAGLIDGSDPPGFWASNDMIANNNSWAVTIPPFIAPGKYVLRHEIIALHASHNYGTAGAQAYPQCINLDITGSGTDPLRSGTLGTELYTADDAGIYLNIYWQPLTSYDIPGPPVISAAVSGFAPRSYDPALSTSATSVTDNAVQSPSAALTTTDLEVITTTSTTTTTSASVEKQTTTGLSTPGSCT